MTITRNRFYTVVLGLVLAVLMVAGLPAVALAAQTKDFVVVLDAGHGGKDHGAIDNGVKEKDINLAVALRLGELIKKKLKHTKVVYTRDDDTFVSLQGRADIANKAKGDLFISIHTNSVDAKNKNRRTVAGASVYTQGSHKDEANLAVAKRENSVIELENGYEQKYAGFDPNKVESYIIFEMAAKHNLAQSHRFAKSAQANLVKIAGRKNRGVHQAGFWFFGQHRCLRHWWNLTSYVIRSLRNLWGRRMASTSWRKLCLRPSKSMRKISGRSSGCLPGPEGVTSRQPEVLQSPSGQA